MLRRRSWESECLQSRSRLFYLRLLNPVCRHGQPFKFKAGFCTHVPRHFSASQSLIYHSRHNAISTVAATLVHVLTTKHTNSAKRELKRCLMHCSSAKISAYFPWHTIQAKTHQRLTFSRSWSTQGAPDSWAVSGDFPPPFSKCRSKKYLSKEQITR